MPKDSKNNVDKYKDAFDLIEQVCNGYRTTIKISYGVGKIVNKRSRKWIVRVLEKEFISDKPLEAIGEAFKVILSANGRTDLLPTSADNQINQTK
jgi:hypothetical protein